MHLLKVDLGKFKLWPENQLVLGWLVNLRCNAPQEKFSVFDAHNFAFSVQIVEKYSWLFFLVMWEDDVFELALFNGQQFWHACQKLIQELLSKHDLTLFETVSKNVLAQSTIIRDVNRANVICSLMVDDVDDKAILEGFAEPKHFASLTIKQVSLFAVRAGVPEWQGLIDWNWTVCLIKIKDHEQHAVHKL